MEQSSLSIIIIHWNTPELLREQLAQLMSFSSLGTAEVIVVDNASGTSLAPLVEEWKNLRFIKLKRNEGFAFAANQGFLNAHGEWLLFLNPDTFFEEEQITELLKVAEKEHLTACSPHDSSPNYQKPVPTLLSLLIEFTPLHRVFSTESLQPKTLVGGHLLIKKKVLENLGGWDERFFLWFEDSDLSKQLLERSLQFRSISTIKTKHLGAQSFQKITKSKKRNIFFISMEMYGKKHFSFLANVILQAVKRHFTNHTLLPEDPRITASIVVPNVNQDILEEFLRVNYHFFDFSHTQLIVVTSARQYFQLKKQYPEVIFIFEEKNKGFAATVNTGLRRATGRYVGTVNDDTILNENFIHQLLPFFKESVASVSPVIKKMNGQIESCGINVANNGRAVINTQSTDYFISQAFNGACVLFARDALEHVGLFDERFGSYLEDIDLGLRFTSAGFLNIATNATEVTHKGQQTSQKMSRKKAWLDMKNWWLVMLKNFSLVHWLRYAPQILIERLRNLSGYIKSR